MAVFTQIVPTSPRSGTSAAAANCGLPIADRRPYLVPVRKPAVSNRRSVALFPHESEDARLTGSTRSLYRRLLALNLPHPRAFDSPTVSREMNETRVTVVSPKIA